MRSTCHVPSFNFFPWCSFRDTEVQIFPVFSIWLPQHVAYDVIIIIKTFYMSSRTNEENFGSIRQAVAEKNTKVLCGQTNKQTNKPAGDDGPILPPFYSTKARTENFLSPEKFL